MWHVTIYLDEDVVRCHTQGDTWKEVAAKTKAAIATVCNNYRSI
jgi:hypothetical protein